MTRRPRSKRSVERRLDALETREERAHTPLAVSYHPDADEYRDGDGNAVAPENCTPLIVIPTDEQIARALQTGDYPTGPE